MSIKTKILLLEDNPNDVELIQHELKKGGINFTLFIVQTEADYFNALESFIPDIILSDYALHLFNGDRAFEIRQRQAPETPFIFVSGTIGEEKSVEYIKNGVTDYALKDKLFTLSPKVKRALREAEEKEYKIKTELELRQSENRFRALIETSGDLITMSTVEGKVIYGSPSLTKLFGYTQEEIVGSFISNIIHPDDLPSFAEKRKAILTASGQSFYNQQRVKHKNGSWIWCEGTVKNMLEVPGVHAFAANFRDISERKLAEVREQFDTDNMDAMINNTSDLMWSVDRNFNLITSNRAFDASIKFAIGRVILKGESVLAKEFDSQQLKKYKKIYERVFAGEAFTETERNELPLETWLNISYSPIQNGDKIEGAACHSQDISKIKIAEKVTIESEKEIREMAESMPQIVWVTTAEGKNIYFNQQWVDYTGLTFEESYGDGWLIPFHEDDKLLAWHAWNSAVNNLAGYVVECRLRKHDGAYNWWLIRGVPKINEKGEIVKWYGTCTDIEKIKRAEEQLIKSERFNRGVLNSITDHIAVVNEKGKIVAINATWEQFSLDNGETTLERTGIGANYFEVCEKAAYAGDEIAGKALQGMKDVLNEEQAIFYLEYPCDSPLKKRWFGLRVMKFEGPENLIITLHIDITNRMLAEIERAKVTHDLIQHHKVESSINYARRLQDGMLISEDIFKKLFYNSFIIDQPKEMVSGDFYWLNVKQGKVMLALGDCTGHGVPGALLSMLGYAMLNNIATNTIITSPDEILKRLCIDWQRVFNHNNRNIGTGGMEMALCCINYENNIIEFAGMGSTIFFITKGRLIKYTGANVGISNKYIKILNSDLENLVCQRIPFEKGDRIYLFSDGYQDQFGGINGTEKFTKKKFRDLILSVQASSIEEQKVILEDTFKEWKGVSIQTDDTLVIGIQL